MIWYLENPLRLSGERLGLQALAANVPWLTLGEWRIDGSLHLQIDVTIQVGETSFDVTLRYPMHFPHSPALVLPTNSPHIRWSSHQFGKGGELCLEWGPDNWHPDISGAMMLESAERLLRGERPEAGGEGDVPTRHSMTVGQELRHNSLRLLLTPQLEAALADIPPGSSASGTLIVRFRSRKGIYFVRDVTAPAGVVTDLGLPGPLADDGWERSLTIFRLAAGGTVPAVGALSGFRSALEDQGFTLGADNYCIILNGGNIHPFLLWPDDDSVSSIAVIPGTENQGRMGDGYGALAGKAVAVVGCGSLGSKMATSLARCGVGSFYLVDDDLLLPGNMVRHDLDWREVGQAKVDALSNRIRLVNANATVRTMNHRLGGQETSGGLESLIGAISGCDLILDCSAVPKVFNYLCAAVEIGKKPMVWAEVFGGGIGGLIARHRPGGEPAPAAMRAAIDQACRDHGQPVNRSVGGYDRQEDDGPPLIADDADVSAIAAHATRLAIDTLLQRSPSIFPVSVYLIGLKKGFVFDQPFETWPIDVGPPNSLSSEKAEQAQGSAEEELAFITGLFEKYADASGSS